MLGEDKFHKRRITHPAEKYTERRCIYEQFQKTFGRYFPIVFYKPEDDRDHHPASWPEPDRKNPGLSHQGDIALPGQHRSGVEHRGIVKHIHIYANLLWGVLKSAVPTRIDVIGLEDELAPAVINAQIFENDIFPDSQNMKQIIYSVAIGRKGIRDINIIAVVNTDVGSLNQVMKGIRLGYSIHISTVLTVSMPVYRVGMRPAQHGIYR